MCFCSVVLVAQQPGQRLQNFKKLFRPNLSDRKQERKSMPPRGESTNLDADGDGVITEQEIYTAIQNNLESERENNPQQYERLMQRFDVDKDRQISMAEAMEMHKEIERRMQQARQRGGPQSGQPGSGDERTAQSENRPLSDGGLLKGIKIEGLNISSDL